VFRGKGSGLIQLIVRDVNPPAVKSVLGEECQRWDIAARAAIQDFARGLECFGALGEDGAHEFIDGGGFGAEDDVFHNFSPFVNGLGSSGTFGLACVVHYIARGFGDCFVDAAS
jgi:hypothetical protein